MVGEAVGVLEDAAANHEAIDFGVFIMELKGVGFVFDVAVDDEFGVGGYLVAEVDNIRDEFIVSGDFAHFLLGAEMDGEGGGVLL